MSDNQVPEKFKKLEEFVSSEYFQHYMTTKLAALFGHETAAKVTDDLNMVAKAAGFGMKNLPDAKFAARYFTHPFNFIEISTDNVNDEPEFSVRYKLVEKDGEVVIDATQLLDSNPGETIPTREYPDYSLIDKLISTTAAKTEGIRTSLAQCAWDPQQFLQALDAHVQQHFKGGWDKFANAHWLVSYFAPDKRTLRLTAFSQDDSWCVILALSERNGVVKIERPMPSLYQAGHAADERSPYHPPFSVPRLGIREAGRRFDPGMTYGPGPYGYDQPNGGSYYTPSTSENKIDVFVSDFSEVASYFEPIRKGGFDVEHEIAIIETIMEKGCGPNLERRFRFTMLGQWGEGQNVNVSIVVEVHDIGLARPISIYQTSFGKTQHFGVQS